MIESASEFGDFLILKDVQIKTEEVIERLQDFNREKKTDSILFSFFCSNLVIKSKFLPKFFVYPPQNYPRSNLVNIPFLLIQLSKYTHAKYTFCAESKGDR